MAGTVLGTVIPFMYITSVFINKITDIFVTNYIDEDTNKYKHENVLRYCQAAFCIMANIFFLSQAIVDYNDLRQSDELTYRRICCFKSQSK